jgi:hypothetical protein
VSDESTPPGPHNERRRKATLRELLDEMIAFTRDVTRRARDMSEPEMEYAHQRLEWLADEVWREAIESGRRETA